ncbi:hypothetical protein CSB67_3470 [Enterobacter hormaechei]|nr:hypothetical protein CSB67_3470 [Enterobacter hormaechei]
MLCGDLLCEQLNFTDFMLKMTFITIMIIHSTSMLQMMIINTTCV